MAKPLIPLTIAAPGFYGLNKQQAGDILPPGWATEARNCVIDDAGRLAARKGNKYLHATAISGSPDVTATHEYVDASGNTLHIVAAADKIYKIVDSTLTDITGTATIVGSGHWKFQNFNGKCVGYQTGNDPIELSTVSGTFAQATGTQYQANEVLSAYGRLWTVKDNVLYYSDLLINNFTGGSSGSFDLAQYWKGGMDEAVAIADFNGYLVVFGKDNIIVYDNPDDPTSSMSIVESISGIGCIARDSVQNAGNDILFLSKSGIRALGRVIQEKSMPLREVSKNIRDYFVNIALAESADNIKSVFNEKDGFYVISFPSQSKAFYFDLKQTNPDGSLKATEWDVTHRSYSTDRDGNMYVGVAGYISKYTDYRDNLTIATVAGATYDIDFESTWSDMGEEVSPFTKILKTMNITLLGGSGKTVIIKWATDYNETFSSQSVAITDTLSRHNVAKHNVGIHSGKAVFNSSKGSPSLVGQVVKIGFTATVDYDPVALQRLDLKAKIGRLL